MNQLHRHRSRDRIDGEAQQVCYYSSTDGWRCGAAGPTAAAGGSGNEQRLGALKCEVGGNAGPTDHPIDVLHVRLDRRPRLYVQ